MGKVEKMEKQTKQNKIVKTTKRFVGQKTNGKK